MLAKRLIALTTAASTILACAMFGASTGPVEMHDAGTTTADAGAATTDTPPRADSSAAAHDGSSVSPCSNPHLFCDDFENGLEQWDGRRGSPKIVARPEGGHMLLTDVPGDAPEPEFERMEKAFDGRPLKIAFSVRVRDPNIGEPIPDDKRNFFIVRVHAELPNADDLSASVYLHTQARWYLTHAIPELTPEPQFTTAFDVWHRVELEVDFGLPASVLLRVDDIEQGRATGSTVEASPRLLLGVGRPNERTPRLHVEYDDVTVDELVR